MTRKITIACLFLLLYLFNHAATIITNKGTYGPGETITVTFGAATTKADWVGMYNSTITPGPQNSISWLYLDGTQTTPAQVIVSGTLNFSAPIVAGSYKMCFHPNDGYTIAATADFTVSTAGASPSAAFKSSSYGVAPGGTINFTDQSFYSPTSWSWSFPGGTPSSSTVQNPTVTYNSAGTYDVSLTVSNANGSNQLSKSGYVIVSAISNTSSDVKFMHLNVWVGGTTVQNGMTYIRDVVASVNPDIVCFVEVENSEGDWTANIVNELAAIGHYYYGGHVNGSDASIISKYPITSSGPLLNSAVSLFNVDINGKTIVVAASHLDYTYYACYLPRGYNCAGSAPYTGWDQIGSPDPHPVTDLNVISAQNLGSQRDEQINAFLNSVSNETRPIVLMGDFNEPSFLDWTINQANLFSHNGVVYQWNTTRSLREHNFTDAFRKIYPDEVLNPGITWPSFATGIGTTSWTPKSDDRDRIDYIFYKGTGVEVVNAAIIGPKGSYAKGLLSTANTENDNFIADTMPWPSDHKGVFSTITIPAASASTYNSLPKNLSSEIKVFPNPGSGVFNLMTSENATAKISITSLNGEEVYNKEMNLVSNNLNALDVSDLPAGVYFLSVVTENSSQTIKIVKQ